MSSLANLAHLLRDERVAAVAARVAKLDGHPDVFDVNEEGDVIVSCLTLNHEVPIWANLDTLAGSSGHGVWFIPDEGTEVMIGFDDGDFEGEAYIIGRTSSGNAPEGLAPGKVFVLGVEVQVRSPNGTAQPALTMDDYTSLKSWLETHVHSGVTTGPGTSAVATTPVPDAVGTQVAKLE